MEAGKNPRGPGHQKGPQKRFADASSNFNGFRHSIQSLVDSDGGN